jgi:hypothetical protein
MLIKRFMVSLLSCALLFVTSNCGAVANQEATAATPSAVQPAQVTAEKLQQLVAPIALYPDELVAQVLAAATYPTEIVEANRWLQQNSSLKDAQLADEVDKQSWDPSVKALTQFPSVLANMDKNLSWTSALGDAYFNQSQDVLNAVQVMRKRAQDAGTLKTTAQQTVTTNQTIVIELQIRSRLSSPSMILWSFTGPPCWYPIFRLLFFCRSVFFLDVVFLDTFTILGLHSRSCDWHKIFIFQSQSVHSRVQFYQLQVRNMALIFDSGTFGSRRGQSRWSDRPSSRPRVVVPHTALSHPQHSVVRPRRGRPAPFRGQSALVAVRMLAEASPAARTEVWWRWSRRCRWCGSQVSRFVRGRLVQEDGNGGEQDYGYKSDLTKIVNTS